MTDKYEPSLKDIITQIYKEGKYVFNIFANKKNIKEFSRGFLKTYLYMGFTPAIIPSTSTYITNACYGKEDKKISTEIPITSAQTSGHVIGAILGTITAIGSFSYVANSTKDNKELLIIPLATNLISGVYEYVKYTKQKLIEQHEKGSKNE